MIKQHNGDVQITGFKKAVSTVFAFNDVVTRDSSGYLVRATATTPRSELLGLIQRDVLSTDTDYASNTLVPVLEFHAEAEFVADVTTGTLVQAMVGKVFDLDDENSIDVNTTLQKSVEIVKVLSTTKAIVKFVTAGDKMRLVSYQQTLVKSDFTDVTTTGEVALNVTIPAGAVFARCLVTDIVAFSGDTTATIQVGDTGGDVDRYSTGTPSVFTTAPAGTDMGAPSGTLWHTSAVVPDVLITTTADFTNVSASAQLTITLFWYQAS